MSSSHASITVLGRNPKNLGHAAGESSPPLDAAVGQSSALTLCKRVQFDGLQVELFEDIDDPIAAAEGENVMSQMRSAELQLAADLEGSECEPFEREAVNVAAEDESESSSMGANDNRYSPLQISVALFMASVGHHLYTAKKLQAVLLALALGINDVNKKSFDSLNVNSTDKDAQNQPFWIGRTGVAVLQGQRHRYYLLLSHIHLISAYQPKADVL